MAGTTKQYILHGILLPGPTWITQLEDTTPAANIAYLTSYGGGATTPSFRGGNSAIPDIRFTTTQIKTILDECTDGDGVSVADYSAGDVDLFYRAMDNYQTTEAIANLTHLRLRASQCMMYWERIEARQGQVATIACRIVPTWDGTNLPLTGLGSQAISAEGLVSDQFTLGPVKVNGTDIDGVQGWTLDQGWGEQITASDGQIYPTFAALRRGDPVLNVDTPDLDQWASSGVTGLSVTALIAFLTHKSSTGVANVANATETHISFTANDNPAGLATVENSSGGADGVASASLRIGLRISTATTLHPLAVDTTAAIT